MFFYQFFSLVGLLVCLVFVVLAPLSLHVRLGILLRSVFGFLVVLPSYGLLECLVFAVLASLGLHVRLVVLFSLVFLLADVALVVCCRF